MPGKILILPEDLTNKIAAGEVVERPASIVKELLENALDAGATDIRIELEKGGKGSIRIVDNGEGIDGQDVPLAFARYATSKIYQFEDIYRVHSFGFRGEALPSIASIARVEMVSRTKGNLAGKKVTVEGGQVHDIADAGCPVGTSLLVSHIFDSVPVRKAFLKTDTTEQGYCIDVITKTALSHSGVRIAVRANGRDILSIPAGKDSRERVAIVLGMDFLEQAFPVQGKQGEATLEGFASRPEWTRSHAKQIYIYVNHRYIRDYLLQHAVMTAYRRIIEAKRYPAVVLFLNLPPAEVDVNVHPAKLEVRFRNPREIYQLIVDSLTSALSGVRPLLSAPGLALPGRPSESGSRRAEYQGRIEEALRRYKVSARPGKLTYQDIQPDRRIQEEQREIRTAEVSEAPRSLSFRDFSYLGQVAGTYLLFAMAEGMILVDQHAAHERILFEKFRRATAKERMASQALLIPEVISLPPRELSFLRESAEILETAGIEAEPFGGDTVIIKAVPAVLGHVEPKAMIMDLLQESAATEGQTLEAIREKILIRLACQGAIKANQRLTMPEVTALCRDLDATPFPASCPHGRPTYISFEAKDLEKMFKRR